MVEEKIGIVEHFFTNISVAAIKITDGELKIGDDIHFVGAHTDLTHHVDHMEVNRVPIEIAQAGAAIGIKIAGKVRDHDIVYKIPKG
jgi:translation elongation factor EF-Tu-like GTPase